MEKMVEMMQPWMNAVDPTRPMIAMMRHGLETMEIAGTRWEEGARQMLDFWSVARKDAVKVMGVTLDTVATEGPAYVGRLADVMAEVVPTPKSAA
ncbi:MAG: hypothetical protein VKP57_10035 [Candidatus Sericytochromatia bacterium]|nr:hypothetical protein [Candidatus Sericytochromatia bacterium]